MAPRVRAPPLGARHRRHPHRATAQIRSASTARRAGSARLLPPAPAPAITHTLISHARSTRRPAQATFRFLPAAGAALLRLVPSDVPP